MPRSLNEPVGFAPSTFSSTRAPTCSESRGASTSGVLPSFSVTTGVRSVTGSRSRYASMMPGQPACASSVIPRLRPRAARSRRVRRPRARALRGSSPPSSASRARCVTKIRRASSPWPFCCIDWIETSCLPNTPAIVGEHTGLVGRVERDVELRRRLVDRADRRAFERADRRAARAGVQVLGRVDEVAEQRARRSGRRPRPGRAASAGRPLRPR